MHPSISYELDLLLREAGWSSRDSVSIGHVQADNRPRQRMSADCFMLPPAKCVLVATQIGVALRAGELDSASPAAFIAAAAAANVAASTPDMRLLL